VSHLKELFELTLAWIFVSIVLTPLIIAFLFGRAK
jgi:hypothetical protein